MKMHIELTAAEKKATDNLIACFGLDIRANYKKFQEIHNCGETISEYADDGSFTMESNYSEMFYTGVIERLITIVTHVKNLVKAFNIDLVKALGTPKYIIEDENGVREFNLSANEKPDMDGEEE